MNILFVLFVLFNKFFMQINKSMKLLLTLCFVIGITRGVFGIKSEVSAFIQSTCPAFQQSIDQLEQSYNGL